jgi:hypothetical protein
MHAGDMSLNYDIHRIDPISAGIDREYQGYNSSYPADAPGKTGVAAGWEGCEIVGSEGEGMEVGGLGD